MAEKPILFSGPMVRALLDGKKTQTRRVLSPDNSTFGSAPRAFWAHADFSRAFVDGKGSGSEYLHVPAHDDPTCEVCREWGWAGTTHRLRPRMAPARCWEQEADEDYTPPASQLWVRETWQYADWTEDGYPFVGYAADASTLLHENIPEDWTDRVADVWADLSAPANYAIDGCAADRKWRPSIFLPRWASRISLEITEVRVERVQDISEGDVEEEGIDVGCFSFCTRPSCWRGADDDLLASDGYCPTCGGSSFLTETAQDLYANLWDSLNKSRGYGWDANPFCWVISFRRVGT